MAPLDGVSATSLIRQFDPISELQKLGPRLACICMRPRTDLNVFHLPALLAPIVSMTSNSTPEDLLAYMSSGMNGHL